MYRLLAICSIATLMLAVSALADTPTAVNYQGRLTDAAGDPVADGSYSVVFTIYDAATVGNSKWTETQPVTTTDGLFSVLLGTINPILDTVFNGTSRYLGISVDAGPEGSPRIKMVTVPFAFQASKSDSSLTSTTAEYADSTGAITDGGVDFADIGQNGASSGQVMKWSESGWTAAADNTGGGSGGWTDDGTVVRLGSTSDSVGIGTTTPSEKLEVTGNILIDGKATIGQGHTNTGTAGFVAGENNSVTAKYASVSGGSTNTASGNSSIVGGGNSNSAAGVSSTVGGGFDNSADGQESSVAGGSLNNASGTLSTIAGGSLSFASGVASSVGGGVSNTASGHFSTVAGGIGNTAVGDSSFVGGGSRNGAIGVNATVSGGHIDTASGDYATVGGGRINTAGAYTATVSGGSVNTASGNYSTVSGGQHNVASYANSTVGGGFGDTASGHYATVGGGNFNVASGLHSTVGGGVGNFAGGDSSFVGGGSSNIASGVGATVSGGVADTASGPQATVGGGIFNKASGTESTIGGGNHNRASGDLSSIGGGGLNSAGELASTVAGGYSNNASGERSSIGGGSANSAAGSHSTVAGGGSNLANGFGSLIAGGVFNNASGDQATVVGGSFNAAAGEYSFAAGHRAKAAHVGAFVWGDSFDGDVLSSTADQFTARASGGVRFFSNTALTTGVTLAAGGGSWSSISDSTLKENIRPVNGEEILEKLSELDISRWNYESQDASIEHIGPMAQDFYRLFGLGEDDTHINTLDPDGISLVAIKALYEKNKKLESEVAELKQLMQDFIESKE